MGGWEILQGGQTTGDNNELNNALRERLAELEVIFLGVESNETEAERTILGEASTEMHFIEHLLEARGCAGG